MSSMLAKATGATGEVGAVLARKTAADYAAMARNSSQCGSKRFVFHHEADERKLFPNSGQQRFSDNPLRYWRGATRFGWVLHDFRVFGLWGNWKKMYYMGLAWYKKGEKTLQGIDENGNKYWESLESGASQFGRARWVEPADPHWFRGGDMHCAAPGWRLWLSQGVMHTPAVVKARGEWGAHGRAGNQTPWNIKYYCGMLENHGIDPAYVPQEAVIVSPWLKMHREAGWARWSNTTLFPTWTPLEQPHDLKPEQVEDFFRMQPHANTMTRGYDNDWWGNGGG